MRKFKSLREAKNLAKQMGWGIAVRIWSEQEQVWLIKFKPFVPQSRFMAGVI